MVAEAQFELYVYTMTGMSKIYLPTDRTNFSAFLTRGIVSGIVASRAGYRNQAEFIAQNAGTPADLILRIVITIFIDICMNPISFYQNSSCVVFWYVQEAMDSNVIWRVLSVN